MNLKLLWTRIAFLKNLIRPQKVKKKNRIIIRIRMSVCFQTSGFFFYNIVSTSYAYVDDIHNTLYRTLDILWDVLKRYVHSRIQYSQCRRFIVDNNYWIPENARVFPIILLLYVYRFRDGKKIRKSSLRIIRVPWLMVLSRRLKRKKKYIYIKFAGVSRLISAREREYRPSFQVRRARGKNCFKN